ncbi:hypothetical protein EBT16_01650 [bacterium]|nr:hypothetical protein [bacterium]
MNKLILYIFSKTSFGKLLDGKKTVIGAVFVILAAALQALEQIAPMFPTVPWLQSAAVGLSGLLKGVEPILETLGVGFLSVGVLHKSVKAKLPPAE